MNRRPRREPSRPPGRLRHSGHEGIRNFCRLLGPVLIVAGVACIVVAVVDFFISASSNEAPTKFWMFFLGIPIFGVGAFLTQIGFMGAAARYVAGEIAPVGKDTINYMAHGTKDAVREITSAVAEGLRGDGGGEVVVRCPKCAEENDDDARFCKECGEALTKSADCPECGELNDPDANFCDNCGKRLG